MNRRQLAFIILVNAVISLLIALLVAWVIELRRPDADELAAIFTPLPAPIATPVTGSVAQVDTPSPAQPTVEQLPTPVPDNQNIEPVEGEVYVVQTGDILSNIASRFGVPVTSIVEANGLSDPNNIFVGQRLTIPGAVSPTEPEIARPQQPEGLLVSSVDGVGDVANEVVRIANESNNMFNLSGWTLGSDGGAIYEFESVTLFPGSGINVHSGSGQNNSVDLYWGQSDPVWRAGEIVRLVDAQGQSVHSYTIP